MFKQKLGSSTKRSADNHLPSSVMKALGLKQQPFEEIKSAHNLFADDVTTSQLDMLTHNLRFTDMLQVLKGNEGAGKSCLLRQLIQRDGEQFQFILTKGRSDLTPDEVIHELLALYQQQDPEDIESCIQQLTQHLKNAAQDNRPIVLIIDSAENIPAEQLSTLFSYTDQINSGLEQGLSVLLAGRNSIDKVLEQSLSRQLIENKVINTSIRHFDQERMKAYLAHKLEIAGHQGILPWKELQLKNILSDSQGLPGAIDLLAAQNLQNDSVIGQLLQQVTEKILRYKLWFAGAGVLLILTALLIPKSPEQDSTEKKLSSAEGAESQTEINARKLREKAALSKLGIGVALPLERDANAPEVAPAEPTSPSNGNATESSNNAPTATTSKTQISLNLTPDAPPAQPATGQPAPIIRTAPTPEVTQEENAVETTQPAPVPEKSPAVAQRSSVTTEELEQELEKLSGTPTKAAAEVKKQPTEPKVAKPAAKKADTPAPVVKDKPAPSSSPPAKAAVEKKAEKKPVAAATPVVAKPAPAATKPVATKGTSQRNNRWLMRQSPAHHTIQVIAADNPAALHRYAQRMGFGKNYAILTAKRNGKVWHSLLFGLYSNGAKARNAIKTLPAEVVKNSPWVRSIGSIQNSINP